VFPKLLTAGGKRRVLVRSRAADTDTVAVVEAVAGAAHPRRNRRWASIFGGYVAERRVE
jgi:hypothetical protein